MRYVNELLISLAIVLVTAWTVYCVRHARSLESQNAELRRIAYEPIPGLYVPPLWLSTVAGERAVIGQEGERQLLFFFNETCPYCRASTGAWREIADRVAGESVVVYGVSLDSVQAAASYKKTHRLTFPVVSQPSRRVSSTYRVISVPLTLVVEPDGRIGYSRIGVLEGRAAVDSVVAAVLDSPTVRGMGAEVP